MPVIPPSTPYDSSEYVLNLARAICNDMALGVDGNLLSDAQPYTTWFLRLAWRKLQARLRNNAIEEFPQEVILPSVPISTSTNPGSQMFIGFNGTFDGTNLQSAPALPSDLVTPLRLWERPSGQNAIFVDMYPTNDGLPSRPQTIWLNVWDWRDDCIFLTGATQVNDIRMRYKRQLADLTVKTSGVDPGPVPILECAPSLAYMVVEDFARSRGSVLTSEFKMLAQEEIQQLVTSTTRTKQRGNHRRIPYSRRGNQGWGMF